MKHYVEKIEILPKGDVAIIHTVGGHKLKMNIGDSEAFVSKLEYTQAKLNMDIWDRVPITYAQEGYGRVIAAIIPSLAIVGLLFFLMKGTLSGVKGVGGSMVSFSRINCSDLPSLLSAGLPAPRLSFLVRT